MTKEHLVVPSSQQAQENGRKGGLASAASKRHKKAMRERFQALMDIDREGMTGADALACAQFEKALGGDTKAFEMIMTYLGDPPQRTVKLTLPKGDGGASSLPGVTAAVLAAVARGKLSPDDAARLATVIGAHAKAIETGELSARIDVLEARGESHVQ